MWIICKYVYLFVIGGGYYPWVKSAIKVDIAFDINFNMEFDINFNMEFDIEFDVDFDFGFNSGGGSKPPFSGTEDVTTSRISQK